MIRTNETTPRWLRGYTKFVAAATLFLIFAGAMVTSTGSGLAVPDWPLSYGMLFPPMVGGIFYEHGHRMIAASVGLLTVIQAFFLMRWEPKRFVRRLGWIAVAVVVAQGLLGGLTVIFLLPLAISVSHAGLAQIFLCLNIAIAFFTSRSYERLATGGWQRGATPAIYILPLIVYLQILAGALMRHLGAGLAIPDFPLAFGRLVPELTTIGVAINFTHRIGAAIVLLVVVLTMREIRGAGESFRLLHRGLFGILVVQIALGAQTVWSGKHPITTSLHVVTGALLLGTAFLLMLAVRTARADEKNEPAAIAREVAA
ncbi:MAG TPA: COX15/CtaA family protein [Thermoanaerobaculia bacterium]|nr:COX15/CtaA family protein [Thermoanaerobaculia bacterium]